MSLPGGGTTRVDVHASPRSHARVAAAAAVVAALAFVVPGGAAGRVAGTSLSGFGTPRIDGVVSPGEWAAAGTFTFTASVPGDAAVPASLRVMNDFQNLYLAVTFARPTLTSSVAVTFDNDHDASFIEEGD